MQAFAVARIASGKLVMRHRFPRLLAKDYAQKATFGSPRRRPAWVSNAVSACEAAPLAVQTIDAKTARRRPLYAVLVEGAGNASDRVGARDRREPGLADEVLIVALSLKASIDSSRPLQQGAGEGDKQPSALIPANAAITASIAEHYKYWGAPAVFTVGALELLHDSTGLTWTPVIIIATLAVRISLMPLSIFSERNSRLFSEQVSPRFGKLWKDLTPDGVMPKTMNELTRSSSMLLTGLRHLYRKHECPPWKTFVSPLVQIPVFVTLSWGVREIVTSSSHPEVKTEGMLWFQDLTVSAMYGFLRWNNDVPSGFFLPMISTALLLLNVELSLGDKLPLLKRFLQILPLATAPYTYQFPQAVFVYWVTSFLFTTSTILAHRHPLWTKMVTYGFPKAPNLAPPVPAVQYRPAPVNTAFVADDLQGVGEWSATAQQVAENFQVRLRSVNERNQDNAEALERERDLVMDECMAYEDEMRHRMKRAQDAAQNEGSEDNYKAAHTRYMVERMLYEEKVVLDEIIRSVREALGRREGGGKDDGELAAAVTGEIERQRGEGGCLVALPPIKVAVRVEGGEAMLVLQMHMEDPQPPSQAE